MATDDGVTGPVNIGNPEEKSIRELAGIILQQMGGTSHIVSLPLPSDDPRLRCPDANTARRTLGEWSPRVILDAGLRKVVEYFKIMAYGH